MLSLLHPFTIPVTHSSNSCHPATISNIVECQGTKKCRLLIVTLLNTTKTQLHKNISWSKKNQGVIHTCRTNIDTSTWRLDVWRKWHLEVFHIHSKTAFDGEMQNALVIKNRYLHMSSHLQLFLEIHGRIKKEITFKLWNTSLKCLKILKEIKRL